MKLSELRKRRGGSRVRGRERFQKMKREKEKVGRMWAKSHLKLFK